MGVELKEDKILLQLHNKVAIDFLAASNNIGKNDPEYDPKTFVFRGEPNTNMNAYIEKKWGKETLNEFKNLS